MTGEEPLPPVQGLSHSHQPSYARRMSGKEAHLDFFGAQTSKIMRSVFGKAASDEAPARVHADP